MEGSNNVNILGKGFLARGSNTCKEPETQFYLLLSRDAKRMLFFIWMKKGRILGCYIRKRMRMGGLRKCQRLLKKKKRI